MTIFTAEGMDDPHSGHTNEIIAALTAIRLRQ
jgi:hypothetical protein